MGRILTNINIDTAIPLATPRQMLEALPQTDRSQRIVRAGRQAITKILDGNDPRLIAIVGPCSIHSIEGATEYAQRLRSLRDEIKDSILVVMRIYFEKPRSVLGWKGLINDPYINDTFAVEDGIRLARQFLLTVADMGLPAATEVLDTLMPQYIGDLISWSAIGARTAESQTHREIASGLSTPVGFKNATDGSLLAAINGIKAAHGPHHFLGVTDDGLPAVFATHGNDHPHIILRGGKKPNFDKASIAACEEALREADLPQRIIVDCSHGNSAKQHERQPLVLREIMQQIEDGNQSICGFMMESHLEAGAQPMLDDPSKLRPGCSITDACIDWETTAETLREAAHRHSEVLNRSKS